ncbi:MerR family transcriptional regulator [Roseiconus lacunae]|uniref:hypothetical protein n=1 Tax=Roseiconus lacunae TaxID=2605694 RepID=UPI001E2BAFEE|nr:hypothetical protein [Roseiconus lacunae]
MVKREVEPVTTKELMELAGIASRVTVRAYEKAGLIEPQDPPDRRRTKGPTKYWSRDCVQICVSVKAMRRDGLDYEQIRKELRRKARKESRSATGPKKRQSKNQSDQGRVIDLIDPRVASTVEAAFREAKRVARHTRDTTTNDWISLAESKWGKAMRIAKSGERPFLVVTEENVEMISESGLGRYVCDVVAAAVIVPLAKYFETEISIAREIPMNRDEHRVVDP